MSERARTPDDATSFREVISQWQLAARTEVKKASSLPSSMFDASDPPLEARLAEAVAAMLQLLHQPTAAALRSEPSGDHLEQRVEEVSTDELRALPGRLRCDLGAPDLDEFVASEYLNLLIDACTTGDAPTRSAARELLAQDFDVAASSDLEEAAAALASRLREHVDGACEATGDEQRLTELCEAIAATVVLSAEPGQEPRP